MGILLTDEQIHEFYVYTKDPFIPRYLDTGRETSKAQLKKVVEWLKERNQYPYNGVTLEKMIPDGNEGLGINSEDWQALLKEVEDV